MKVFFSKEEVDDLLNRVSELEQRVMFLEQARTDLNEQIDGRLNAIEQTLEGRIVERCYVKEMDNLYSLAELRRGRK